METLADFTRREFNGTVLAGFLAALGGGVGAPVRTVPCALLDIAIAGGHYHGLASTLPDLINSDCLELRREPENPFDRFAIGVYRAGTKLGYVPRAVNPPLATLMDAGRQIRAEVVGFLDAHGDQMPQGLAYTGFTHGDPQIRLLLEGDPPEALEPSAALRA